MNFIDLSETLQLLIDCVILTLTSVVRVFCLFIFYTLFWVPCYFKNM